MYIIFKFNSREYFLNQPDQVFYFDYQKNVKTGEKITADQVLFCDGKFRKSDLTNIELEFEVLEEKSKEKKILVLKYKRKKGSAKKMGHRQSYTKVRCIKIKGISEVSSKIQS